VTDASSFDAAERRWRARRPYARAEILDPFEPYTADDRSPVRRASFLEKYLAHEITGFVFQDSQIESKPLHSLCVQGVDEPKAEDSLASLSRGDILHPDRRAVRDRWLTEVARQHLPAVPVLGHELQLRVHRGHPFLFLRCTCHRAFWRDSPVL
jgi:hypothetical protein